MSLEVRFSKIDSRAVIPTVSYQDDACFDLTAIWYTDGVISPTGLKQRNKVYTYHTGINVEIPTGYVGLIIPRVSCYVIGMLPMNGVGVVSPSSRGELCITYYSLFDQHYYDNDRVGQLLIVSRPEVRFNEVNQYSLSPTYRGNPLEGQYRSTYECLM